MRLPHQ